MSHTRRHHGRTSVVPTNFAPTSTCPSTGKLRFTGRKAARRYAASNELAGLNAYECATCGDWHLGHLPKMVRDGDAVRWDIQPRVDGT